MYEKKLSLIPSDGKYSIKGYLLDNKRIMNIRKYTDSEAEFYVEFSHGAPLAVVDNSYNSSMNSNNSYDCVVCQPVLSDLHRNKRSIYKDVRRHPIDCDEYDSTPSSASNDGWYVSVSRNPGRIPRMRKNQTPCEYLNQFSSVFVDNLKEQIPKDPLTRPVAYNNYVSPKKKDKNYIFHHSSTCVLKKKKLRDVRYVTGGIKTSECAAKKSNRNGKNCSSSSSKEKMPICWFCFPCFM